MLELVFRQSPIKCDYRTVFFGLSMRWSSTPAVPTRLQLRKQVWEARCDEMELASNTAPRVNWFRRRDLSCAWRIDVSKPVKGLGHLYKVVHAKLCVYL